MPVLLAFALVPTQTFAQLKRYQFEDLEQLQRTEKRMVVVFIHTDWCKYCQTMNNTTFKNKDIIEQMNNQFYFVDFNAEETRNITFKNSVFKYTPSGMNTGSHELAEHLGTIDNKVSYPTLCFLNSDSEIIFQYPQYINSAELMTAFNLLK